MDMISLKVISVREVAADIFEYRLAAPGGGPLPGFTPGAHLHVRVPSGGTRQYSLCNDPADRESYVIAVKREDTGRGGSVSLIESTRQGDTVQVSTPRNDFKLDDDAGPVTLIAGGIGITPILSMARVLQREGRAFRMYYLTRNPELTAYATEIRASILSPYVTIHHDHGDPTRSLDMASILANPAEGAQIYCCGPTGLLKAVRAAAAHWARGSVRFEDFGATPARKAAGADTDGFWVTLEDTGERIHVSPEQTILQAMQEAGMDVTSSCEAGTCGTCRMRLLSGEVDHRDLVLFDDEMDDNIIICCSRAKSAELVVARV